MALRTTATKARFNGNSSATVFPFTFIVNDADDLVVTRSDLNDTPTPLYRNSDYIVTLNDDGTGSVTYPIVVGVDGNGNPTYTPGTPMAPGNFLTVQRIVDLEQGSDYNNLGGFRPDQVEEDLDHIVMGLQQLQEQIDRAVKVSATSGLTGDYYMDQLTQARDNAVLARQGAEAQAFAALAASEAAVAAQAAAEQAADSIGTSVSDAQAAKTAAEAAQAAAETAKTSAESAKTAAETAATNAGTAKTAAEAAQTAAETAKTGAETAKSGAETAKTGAETARTGAETAKTAAETAATNASSYKDTAQAASTSAQNAQTAAEAAATAAQAAGGGGGGGSLQWIAAANAPLEVQDGGLILYRFGAALAQEIWACAKVPANYTAGKPVKLRTFWKCAGSSGNVLMQSISYLIQGGDTYNATGKSETSINTAVTIGGGTVDKPQPVELNLCDGSGMIGGSAIAAGNLIRFKVTRGTDTAAADVDAILHAAEVTFT